METFHNPTVASGQKQGWYPWPYREGLTIAEATNDLAFIATGLYGKPIPKQNGAPLRLAVPWKYGFKSVKSIARFSFTEKTAAVILGEGQFRGIRFLGQCEPQSVAPAPESGDRACSGKAGPRTDAALQWLRGVRR